MESGSRFYRNFLSNLSLFSGLASVPVFEEFVVNTGNTLQQIGAMATHLCIVAEGSAKAWIPGTGKRSLSLQLLRPGSYYGMESIIDGEPEKSNVAALEPGIVLAIERDYLIQFANRHPELPLRILQDMTRRVRRMENLSGYFVFASAPQRLKAVLAELTKANATNVSEEWATCSVNLSQHELSNFAGLGRETVSRLIAKWTYDGVIRRSDRQLSVSKTFLNNKSAA